jgi:hypothetical protein
MSVVTDIIKIVKQKQCYIPREYKTVGGIWTVDTYKLGEVTVQVMDEGYTTVIQAPSLKIVSGYNGQEYVRYELGDELIAETVLQSLQNQG